MRSGPKGCPDLRGLRQNRQCLNPTTILSERLPRFEGFETTLLLGPKTRALLSERLPRFEGFETLHSPPLPLPTTSPKGCPDLRGLRLEPILRSEYFDAQSERLPRFEGFETSWRDSNCCCDNWSERLPRFEGFETL